MSDDANSHVPFSRAGAQVEGAADVWVHLPPQAGSPPWRRAVALDFAARAGGTLDEVFRRAEAYVAWLAAEGGGEFEAAGHPGATNAPTRCPAEGSPDSVPQDGAQRAVEMVEAAAEALHADATLVALATEERGR